MEVLQGVWKGLFQQNKQSTDVFSDEILQDRVSNAEPLPLIVMDT